MGGPGSGNWCRWDKKATLDEVKQIDVRYLRRNKLLKPGATGSLQWSSRGQSRGNLHFTYQQDYLQLNYRYKTGGDEWKPVEEFICFDWTPCNYGGDRLWFKCPHCSRRVAILYGYGVRFLCRHCYKIPYSSQQEGRIDRAIGQKHKLGARTFEHYEHGEGWGKPKGMHWKTFNRLKERYWHYESAVNNEISNYLERTKGLFGPDKT